jgi:hypothetical protein
LKENKGVSVELFLENEEKSELEENAGVRKGEGEAIITHEHCTDRVLIQYLYL